MTIKENRGRFHTFPARDFEPGSRKPFMRNGSYTFPSGKEFAIDAVFANDTKIGVVMNGKFGADTGMTPAERATSRLATKDVATPENARVKAASFSLFANTKKLAQDSAEYQALSAEDQAKNDAQPDVWGEAVSPEGEHARHSGWYGESDKGALYLSGEVEEYDYAPAE